MKRFTTLSALFLVLILLANCGSSDANDKNGQAADTTAQDSAQTAEKGDDKDGRGGPDKGPSAVPVEVTRLTRGDISSFLQYSATLETEQIVDVYPRIGGLVEVIYVEEGARVYKGQKLLQIEKEEYELREQNAKIEYQKQERVFKRLQALQVEDLLSQEEYDNAELVFRQAEIAWKQAALSLRYTTVTSPISGVVGERMVNLGDRVQAANQLFRVANLDEKIVEVYVPQGEYAQIFKKQSASISTSIYENEKFEGFVKRISPIVDPQSGTFKVTVAVKDKASRLRPGMFVNTELIVDTHADTRLLPKSALIYENERTYFFIVEQDSSRKVELHKGFEDSEKVEALNDLPVGTMVVVLGQSGLKEGTQVKVIDEKRYAWQPTKPSATLSGRRSLTDKG